MRIKRINIKVKINEKSLISGIVNVVEMYYYCKKKKQMIKSKLISVRTQKGFSQEKVADLIGMGQSSYCRREKGLVSIMDHEWTKIAKALGVDKESIYEQESNQSHNVILENMQKYVARLEQENQSLKKESEIA
ncbi:helix-turn-helix transcriptional regulator [Flavobacterium restrictum]|uniref:Helix-turn-helix transcriptional regulator n=2 Tax=Flavobacterium restrictum TaxID=2594428 RepID=A0A553E8Q8_9FLAO|nr:helix-turn-helix transcriptional regulator [Flavobacterium restrictum]